MKFKGVRSKPQLGLELKQGSVRRGLPVSWKRGRLLAFGLGSVAMGALLWPLREASRADELDGWWLRARLAWATRPNAEPSASASASPGSGGGSSVPIVLVLMDDDCTRAWTEPTILWGPHMASALDRITRDGAQVIGLDWIQTTSLTRVVPGVGARQNAARDLFASYDLRLCEALSRTPKVVMPKEFRGSKGGGDFLMPTPEILYSLPGVMGDSTGQAERVEKSLGYVDLNTRSSVIAAQEPWVLKADSSKPEGSPCSIEATSFAARLVEKARGGSWSASSGRRLLLLPSAPDASGASRGSQVLGAPLSRVELRENGTVLINYALARGGGASTPYTSGAFPSISMAKVVSGRTLIGFLSAVGVGRNAFLNYVTSNMIPPGLSRAMTVADDPVAAAREKAREQKDKLKDKLKLPGGLRLPF